MAFRHWGLSVLALVAFGAGPVAADPYVASAAEASSWESGEDPGGEEDFDSTDTPGETAEAATSLCLGSGVCSGPPGSFVGGNAHARTTYGSNHARSFAESAYDFDNENDIVDFAAASSYWADEWMFQIAPQAVSRPVELEFRIDGSWSNDGYARFLAAVGQRLVPPPEPNPEEPPPLLQYDVENVTGVDFESTRDEIFVLPGGLIQNPGDDSDGNIDMTVTISFVPTEGDAWIVQAFLMVRSSVGTSEQGDVSADFDSTAELVRVVVPEGVSFISAAGASYNVEVPEPGAALLIALGAAALAFARRARV